MQDRMLHFFQTTKDKWLSFEKSQRYRIVAIAVVLLTALIISIYFMVRPNMVVLVSNVDTISAGEIKNTLDEAGIKNTVVKNATAVMVEDKDVTAAQLLLTEKNVPSSGGGSFTYQDALSFSGMGTTESVKRENFIKVKESEIAKSLEQFPSVKKATVNLQIPATQNYFLKDNDQSRAGIILDLDNEIDRNQATSIARYVSRSVEGLSIDNIEVIDTSGKNLYSGILNSSEEGVASGGYTLELQRKKEIENQIIGQLAGLYDEIKPAVNLKLNWDKENTESSTKSNPVPDSSTGLVENQTKEKSSVTNAGSPQEPGAMANDQATTTYQSGQNSNSSASTSKESTSYIYNDQKIVKEKAVGEIVQDNSSISVFVYKNRPYYEDYLRKNNTITDAIGWENFKEQNRNQVPLQIDQTEFDRIVEGIRAGTGIQSVQLVAYEVPVFYDLEVKPIAYREIAVFAILAILILLLAIGLIKTQKQEEITEIEPELSVEDLLVSTQMEEQREAESEAERLREIEMGGDSEIKKQIEKFVNERPEAVAQLLRNWLNEDWK